MKKTALVLGVIALFAVTFGYGQQPTFKVKIDFPFVVGGKALPAGQYEVARDSSVKSFVVKGEGKHAAVALILTQLAGEIHTSAGDGHLVFDRVGDKHVLSEIWLPSFDGYLLVATKSEHKHDLINFPWTK